MLVFRILCPKTYIFSGTSFCIHTINAVFLILLSLLVWRYINGSIPTKHLTLTLRKSMYMRASGASELRILKLLFCSIFCWYFRYFFRYKWHACRLTCTDKFPNILTKLRKSIMGGGGVAPLSPSGYASDNVPCRQTPNLWHCWIIRHPYPFENYTQMNIKLLKFSWNLRLYIAQLRKKINLFNLVCKPLIVISFRTHPVTMALGLKTIFRLRTTTELSL